jgi:hypothetical protein
MSSRPADPRGASRRKPSTFGEETGLDVANDAPAPTTRQFLGRKPLTLPMTGCHLYQGPSIGFPGTMQVWNRCPAHQPPGSIDLGPVPGWCLQCERSAEFQAPVTERTE